MSWPDALILLGILSTELGVSSEQPFSLTLREAIKRDCVQETCRGYETATLALQMPSAPHLSKFLHMSQPDPQGPSRTGSFCYSLL